MTAAMSPDSGTHCGDVSCFCCSDTRMLVSRNSSSAAGSRSSRMRAEAFDIYASETALPARWFARVASTMPV